ncbi:conserved Plasmodium protein, unknown function [Plasmodium vinckei vinckei]|uniref:Uncharacterized protein n=1 Tax=Plasmodium vinckei vinckei TaxID=54757 RepID=A0A449BSU0_PLAVN|nr:conserved Plasmodium protein, unknown function [Plasmodium vinckei vinckei]KEG02254.1 hypothetical protein YYE_02993 [Plasmodium vinckei vinckei]VEV56495.1 conserved Plasmodium protein, unknown function [Plasmodium vinckei vinckei]
MSIYYAIHIIMILFMKGYICSMKSNSNERNYFAANFYNNRLTKTFHKGDYHFFRLVFMKILVSSNLLNKNITIDGIVKNLDNMIFGINQKNNESYSNIYEEIKKISLIKYKQIYEKNELDIKIANEIEKEIAKEVAYNIKLQNKKKQDKKNEPNLQINNTYRKKRDMLSFIPFNKIKFFYYNNYQQALHIFLEILYISIIASYQTLDDATKKQMILIIYENTVIQWLVINNIHKIMKHKLSINTGSILLYITLDRKNDAKVSQEDIYNIYIDLMNIIKRFFYRMLPQEVGHKDLSYIFNEFTKMHIPELKILGYRTIDENKLDITMDKVLIGSSTNNEEDDEVRINSGKRRDDKKNDEDFHAKFFEKKENQNKIMIQIFISTPHKKDGVIEDQIYDSHFTIENMYNILMDNVTNQLQFSLTYKVANFYMARYIFGDSENPILNDEETKYEEVSMHIFLKLKFSINFTFKNIKKYILTNIKNISRIYSIHIYGACVKNHITEIIDIVGQFGEAIDHNLINHVIINMDTDKIVVHIKVYSESNSTIDDPNHNDVPPKSHSKYDKKKLIFENVQEVNDLLNKSNYFDIIYYIIDRTKGRPKSIDCATCRHYKYHYTVLFIAGIIPSLIILLAFYIICYCKIKKCKNSKNICSNKLAYIYPKLFYVKTASNKYKRLSKKHIEIMLLRQKKNNNNMHTTTSHKQIFKKKKKMAKALS